jgi:hypothetical protein
VIPRKTSRERSRSFVGGCGATVDVMIGSGGLFGAYEDGLGGG